MMWRRAVCGFATAMFMVGPASQAQDRSLDQVFSKWATRNTPGCAVGVLRPDGTAIERAYGMADLEHDVPNRPDTIFEAGSVSKQFTAAAVLLLARDGKLSLDDAVRKYVPELPDYGTPVTIRHLVMHTSGLRDWGAIVDIAGASRWTRVYTQADVLAIASRQKALNFTPGTQWSYTNTGYNLAAMIVSRVGGTSFDEFTRMRIFEPLKMTHTSWDSDHTRTVKNRAMAYTQESDGFHSFMPFEDVVGNRGLLTTVGDLLKWSQNFDMPLVGDRAFVQGQQTPGRFTDGRQHTYGFGLFTADYKGLREVGHDGGTAGYRADLVRFPDEHLPVAVLCNATTADATAYAHEVADLYLHDRETQPAPSAGAAYLLSGSEIRNVVGLYRSDLIGRAVTVSGDAARLQLQIGRATEIPLAAASAQRFNTPFGVTFTVDDKGTAVLADTAGILSEHFTRVTASHLTAAELKAFIGTYHSDDADVSASIVLDQTSVLLRRPSTRDITLTPTYADAFTAGPLGTVIFRRNAAGAISGFSVVQDRVWNLPFTRVP